MAFVVAGHTPALADPGEGALHPPAQRQDDEFVQIATADDLQTPASSACHRRRHLRSLVAAITDDALNKGEQFAHLAQQRLRSITVLHIGRMHDHAKQQAQRIGQDMALAPENLLARVIARGIKRRAPFCAPFALWLSMIAVVGLASRPSCSRTAM